MSQSCENYGVISVYFGLRGNAQYTYICVVYRNSVSIFALKIICVRVNLSDQANSIEKYFNICLIIN